LGLPPWGEGLAGAVAVVGHNYSLFLNFRGGAGTATSVGAAAVLWPLSLPILILSGVVVGLLFGHASVASIWIAVMLPVLFALRGQGALALAFGVPAMLLTIWALRPNIRRLAQRRERFLPIYRDRPPPICLSRHPPDE
jgi:glycerol-3-phosphate acyltransferase PlsY